MRVSVAQPNQATKTIVQGKWYIFAGSLSSAGHRSRFGGTSACRAHCGFWVGWRGLKSELPRLAALRSEMMCKQRNQQNEWNGHTQQIKQNRAHKEPPLLNSLNVITLPPPDGGGKTCTKGTQQQRKK